MVLILDVTVGPRKLYHKWDQKLNVSQFIGVDSRRGDFSILQKDHPKTVAHGNLWVDRIIIVIPTIQADMRYLPIRDHVIDVLIFDPPHMDCGLQSFFGKYYGSWNQSDVIRHCRAANVEFARVLKANGTIIMKIMPRDFPLYETLLKNFCFFLPIQTKRPRGSMKNPSRLSDADGALWCIGVLKAFP